MEIFRQESKVFEELTTLCSSPGYLHAIAYFCVRDNTIKYADEITSEDVLEQFTPNRLIRTEISTLIGLANKFKQDLSIPSNDVLSDYIEKTENLLEELHHTMLPSIKGLMEESTSKKNVNPFSSASHLREPIFYSGEAAYYFQYRDFSGIKYQNDNEWFIKKKGYSIKQAINIIKAIASVQTRKSNENLADLIKNKPNHWSFLPSFIFTLSEILEESNESRQVVESFLESFTCQPSLSKANFNELSDFNPTNAYPIFNLDNEEYLLFQNYSLGEAFYETPFFWMNDDPVYKNIAAFNRGSFTEYFSTERLKLVFGEKQVFTNIEIYKGKTRVGEIDVLVVFSKYAIVLQAKSKKLTLAARKGNDKLIRSDFKKAVEEAYEQAYECSEFLLDKECTLLQVNGNELDIERNFTEIYPFCITSEHYPALSFQSRQFLTYKTSEIIKAPFVMDLFLLDVMTEMLESPLLFLSYVNRRISYGERLHSTHELTILGCHLKQNLWFEEDKNLILLSDDIAADLDLAMLARRDNAPGPKTPDGILTKYRDSYFRKIINQIEYLDDPQIIDLGFTLLYLNGETIEHLNDGISNLVKLCLKDGKHHDLTLGMDEGKTGLTIHCNNDPLDKASKNLNIHCEKRKYSQKASKWFGLSISPKDASIKFGINLSYEWKQSIEMDKLMSNMKKPQYLKPSQKINFNTYVKKQIKIGRNDPCHCGSGKKYKRCCL